LTRGPVSADLLGVTLIHEHVFVRNPELEVNLPDGEWDQAEAVESAIAGLTDLYELGVETVVDLTVSPACVHRISRPGPGYVAS
jgi:phosphotriesterase-related protein